MSFINFRYFPVLFTCENQSSENRLRPEKGSRSDLKIQVFRKVNIKSWSTCLITLTANKYTVKMLEETADESDSIYGTQPIEEVDIQIYREIKKSAWSETKESFIECLVQKYDDINELNEVGKSMYIIFKSIYQLRFI